MRSAGSTSPAPPTRWTIAATARADPWVQQRGDLMVVILPLCGDGGGTAGFSRTTSASTRSYRDGQLFGATDQAGAGRFVIPEGTATYWATTQATRVSGTWTFHGDRADGVRQYPVSAVRFTPPLDDNGAVGRGFFLLPVSVQDQAGTTSKQRLRGVAVSYDQGTTWQTAPLVGGYALLYHPADATSESLGATAGDHAGNSVDQTVIDAYLLR